MIPMISDMTNTIVALTKSKGIKQYPKIRIPDLIKEII